MEHFGIYSPVLGKREDFPSIFLQNAFTADNSNIRLYNGEIHSAKMRVKELAETTVTQGTVTQATGSAALNGTGTAWHAGYNGRAILVNGNSYTISSVTGETSLILNTTPSYLLNNCVAYWKLNETSGTDISDEMGTNDGVSAVDASGMTAAGKIGNCLQFDGANDYIEVADHSSLDFGASTDFSIVMLFKTNDDGNPMWLIHKGTSYITGANFTIRKTAANILTASIGDGTNVVYVSSDSVINDNDWHQVIVSCNRDGNMTMYIDGVSNGSQDISAVGDIDNNEKLYIGCNNSKAQKWNGYIDDTMIFNKAVNATEAAYIYNSGSGRTEFLTGISYQIGTLGKIVATPDSNPVLKYHTHITDTGTEILLAFTKDHIYRWETTGNAWYLMYTCTSSCTYWDVASFNGGVAATNNIDIPLWWSGDTANTFTGLDDASNGPEVSTGVYISTAVCLAVFENHILLGGVTLSSGQSYPNHIYGSDLDDETGWIAGSSSDAYSAYVAGDGIITAMGIKGDYLFVFKENSIRAYWYTGTTLIYNSHSKNSSVGCKVIGSINNDPEGNLYFYGSDLMFREIDLGIISNAIEPTTRNINPSSTVIIGMCSLYVREYGEIWWAVPSGNAATANNKILCYKDGKWTVRDIAVTAFGSYNRKAAYTWNTLPFDSWDEWGWESWDSIEASEGFPVDICSDASGNTYAVHGSNQDIQAAFTSYFTLSTDMANKQMLRAYKRLLWMLIYTRNEEAGSLTISIKRDNEPNWQTSGVVSLSGTNDLNVVRLPVDHRAKHFLIKISGTTPFKFLGMEFDYQISGLR